MNFNEALRLAVGSIAGNKLRALLTLLGVIIGITSVIAILTLGHALQTQMTSALSGSGLTDAMVSVTKAKPKDGKPTAGQDDPFSDIGFNIPESAKLNPETEVQLRADSGVPYGRVVEVMGEAQKAGLNRIGFVADPTGAAPPVPAASQ